MPHSGHVYVAVSGYGKRVVAAAMPFEFARADDEGLVATATSGDSPHTRRIATDAPSDRGMANPVATVIDGPERRDDRFGRTPSEAARAAVVGGPGGQGGRAIAAW